jgi:hypothetical protein
MFRKPPGLTFFLDVRLILVAWLGIVIAYRTIYAGGDDPGVDEGHSSPPGRHPRRIGIGLGLAQAMVTFGVTAPLIGVLLIVGRPGMSRGLYASPWPEVVQAVGLGGLLVGMVWMLLAWRSFLEDL